MIYVRIQRIRGAYIDNVGTRYDLVVYNDDADVRTKHETFEGPDLSSALAFWSLREYVEAEPISKLQFMLRFTVQERIAARQSENPVVDDFMELLGMSENVDITFPSTVQGVQYLESVGIIGEGRAQEILSA